MSAILLDVPDQIKTPRLLLRTPRMGDGLIITASVCESIEELKLWMPWATDDYNESAGEEWCRRCAAEFLTRTQLQYCIFTQDGQHAGNVGAFKFDWAIPACEVGYWLRTKLVGQGFMTEAVQALFAMLTGHLGMQRVQIRCDRGNRRSAAVAERCGFALDGVLRLDRRDRFNVLQDTCVYSRIA